MDVEISRSRSFGGFGVKCPWNGKYLIVAALFSFFFFLVYVLTWEAVHPIQASSFSATNYLIFCSSNSAIIVLICMTEFSSVDFLFWGIPFLMQAFWSTSFMFCFSF